MSRRVVASLVVCLAIALAVPLAPSVSVNAEDEFSVGFSVPSESDPFFIGMSNGAAAAAEDLNIDVLFKTADNDPAVELENVQALIEAGVDALVISPVGGTLSADVMALVEEAAVPLVVTGDQVDLSDLENVAVASLVLPYNEQGGWLAGSLLCESIGSAGNVLEVSNDSPVSIARSVGFNMYMSENCTEVTVQALDVTGLEDDAVIDAVSEVLAGETAINGIITYDDVLTLAVVDAAVVARAAKIVGFDATDDVMVALQDGRVAAVVTPVGWLLGAAGVETALQYVQGMEVEPNVWVNMGVLNLSSVMAFRSGPGGDGAPGEGDPRMGSFEGGPGSGQLEGGPGSGQFEGGPGSGQMEGGPGSGQMEGGPGSGQVE